MIANAEAFGLLIGKLESLARLEERDREALMALPVRIGHVPADYYLVTEGERPDECCFLVSGYACRHKLEEGGRRQIVSFHLPGDLLDTQHLLLARADHNVQTITAASIAWVPIPSLIAVVQRNTAVMEALWRDTLIEASIFREWVLNVGRRDAKSRIAHMLCEFAVRRERAGLGGPERFELPMTQEQIGDATGLTPVHVNRMLQELRRTGVISGEKREILIQDWAGLRRVAGFDQTYLHAA